jgi:diguanylate cyclase (GGDEF)-like protein
MPTTREAILKPFPSNAQSVASVAAAEPDAAPAQPTKRDVNGQFGKINRNTRKAADKTDAPKRTVHEYKKPVKPAPKLPTVAKTAASKSSTQKSTAKQAKPSPNRQPVVECDTLDMFATLPQLRDKPTPPDLQRLAVPPLPRAERPAPRSAQSILAAAPRPAVVAAVTAPLPPFMAETSHQIIPVEPQFDLVGILSAVEETAYIWDIATDKMEWESNAASVLGMRRIDAVCTGSGFQFLIAPEHLTRRQSQILSCPGGENGKPVPYRTQYRFTPGGKRSEHSIWLEDHGCWWADAAGNVIRARGVIRVINERHKEEQRLLHLSDHDELTGQLNRIRLTEALETTLKQCGQTHQSCAFLMIAVNNLSVINETFGFDIGDEVVAAVAKLIKSKLRGGDSIGRYSSNKFGIILNDCGPGSMRIAAERFMKAVRDAAIKTSACQLSATIAVGGLQLPEQAKTVSNATSCALQALARARDKRHDSFHAYEPSPQRDSARKRNVTIADDVISALDEHRMLLALQPIVRTTTRRADLYECLLRMQMPDGRILAAGEFIEVAEQLGLSRLIDRRVLELSVDLAKKHPDLRLSVNVSSLTCSDHEWLVLLHRLTGGQRSITSRLTIEITETTVIGDLDQTINFVDTLKELGCRVAIDDFGAGYTSFKNLKHLAVDMVKIDGGFVKNLSTDKADLIFVKTLASLAKSFGMETVAEWVGDNETAKLCKDVGIDHLQGFLFGTPFLARDLVIGQARALG